MKMISGHSQLRLLATNCSRDVAPSQSSGVLSQSRISLVANEAQKGVVTVDHTCPQRLHLRVPDGFSEGVLKVSSEKA